MDVYVSFYTLDLLKNVWDPLSSYQTKCLKHCITFLLEEFPSIPLSSHSYESMFKALIQRTRTILDKDVFIPLFSPE